MNCLMELVSLDAVCIENVLIVFYEFTFPIRFSGREVETFTPTGRQDRQKTKKWRID
jgi:hypothetical protein